MTDDMLTIQERSLIVKLGECWDQFTKICGTERSRKDDLQEVFHHIHALQIAVMAQAAARAYPDEFRLLGGLI